MPTVSPKMSLGAFAAQNLYAERQGIGTVATPLDLRRSNCPHVASSDVVDWAPRVLTIPPAFQLPGRGVF